MDNKLATIQLPSHGGAGFCSPFLSSNYSTSVPCHIIVTTNAPFSTRLEISACGFANRGNDNADPSCFGDTYIRLVDDTDGREVAANDDACGQCSRIVFDVDSVSSARTGTETHNFTVYQSCADSDSGSCGGQFAVTTFELNPHFYIIGNRYLNKNDPGYSAEYSVGSSVSEGSSGGSKTGMFSPSTVISNLMGSPGGSSSPSAFTTFAPSTYVPSSAGSPGGSTMGTSPAGSFAPSSAGSHSPSALTTFIPSTYVPSSAGTQGGSPMGTNLGGSPTFAPSSAASGGGSASGIMSTFSPSSGGGKSSRDILVALFSATNGNKWIKNFNWNSNNPLSSWYGVALNGNGSVVELNLNRNNLKGTIPSELSGLKDLQTLNLNGNSLSSTIPSELGLMRNIRDFHLSENKLSKTIPTQLGNFDQVQNFFLHDNSLTGTLPTEIGLMTSMQLLNVEGNRLNGTLPSELGHLTNLWQGQLNANQFTGTIPSQINSCSSLKGLILSDNDFQGKLDLDINKLSFLTYLAADNLPGVCYPSNFNSILTLSLVNTTARCQGLQDIAICDFILQSNVANRLSRQSLTISSVIESSHYGLARSNNGQDTITTFAVPAGDKINNPNLQLNLQFDPHSSICSTDSLKVCYDIACQKVIFSTLLMNGKFTQGPIILSPSVSTFYVILNAISRDGLTDTACMNYVYYWGYKITVTYQKPTVGWNCAQPSPLQALGVANLNVNGAGKYATGFCDSSGSSEGWSFLTCSGGSVTAIDLSYFGIAGKIPTTFGFLTALTSWKMSFNSLQSPLPTEVANLQSLQYLDLSSNAFSGSLPYTLGSISGLKNIFLQNNRFQYEIPFEWAALQKLQTVYLAGNQLSGKLESDFCSNWTSALVDVETNKFTCYEHCWSQHTQLLGLSKECAPSSAPTSMPTNPTSFPTRQPTRNKKPLVIPATSSSSELVIVVGTVVGMVALALIVLSAVYIRRKFTEHRRKVYIASALEKLPIHRDILNGESAEVVIASIKEYSDTISTKDPENSRTVVDLILDEQLQIDKSVVIEVLSHSLPLDPSTLEPVDFEKHCSAWFRLVSNQKFADHIDELLSMHVQISLHLIRAIDSEGETAYDIAHPKCRPILRKHLCFYRRYEVSNINHPLNRSSTGAVFASQDYGDESDSGAAEGTISCALKFIKGTDFNTQEQRARERILAEIGKDSLMLSEYYQYVIGTMQAYSSQTDSKFLGELKRFPQLSDYSFLVVMPLADASLSDDKIKGRLRSSDEKKIRGCIYDIASALQFVHKCKVIHGDIKTNNVVRVDNSYKLIDFDGSAIMKDGYNSASSPGQYAVGLKYSSAYAPPELFHLRTRTNEIIPKTFSWEDGRLVKNVPEADLVEATAYYDSWSYGVLVYNLCAPFPLFKTNEEDKIGADDLFSLYTCSPEFLERSLSSIENPMARHLLSRLLVKEPSKRALMGEVLCHPFLTGSKSFARLIGEKAQFDVFISYRVNSDAHHAEIAYNALTAAGLKVWWDKLCLKGGVPWEEGFCEGLIQSKIFLPLLSRNAIKNFPTLGADSYCDNVLLEHHLALELRERGLIEFIYPVMIGDEQEVIDLECDTNRHVYKNYFGAGCHPNLSKADVVVSSVKAKCLAHLQRNSLGSMLLPSLTVKDIVSQLTSNQGCFIEGERDKAFKDMTEKVLSLGK